MLSSGEKESEIGDAVPGRGNLATSSGFISPPCCFAGSGILADGSLGASPTCPLEAKASAPPSTAAPTVVATRRTTCIRGVGRADATKTDDGEYVDDGREGGC